MQKYTEKLGSMRRFILPILVTLAVFVYLQVQGRYLFYYLEQQQMFLYTTDFVVGILCTVGGLSRLIAYFLAQFFVLPCCGALITTALLALAAHGLNEVLKKLSSNRISFAFAWLPSFLLVFMVFQTDFFYQGVVAFVMAALSLWGYASMKSVRMRFILGCIGTLVLYYFLGSMALSFAFAAAIYELFTCKRLRFYGIIYILLAFFLGFVAVRLAWVGDFSLAYTPRLYYDAVSTMPGEFHCLGLALPVLLIICGLLGKMKSMMEGKAFRWLWVIQIAIFVFTIVKMEKKYVERDILPTMQLDYLVYHRQWKDIESFYKKHQGNFVYLNCYNMALAEQGLLGDKMFDVSQLGPFSLSVGEDNTELVSGLLAEVDYSMGNVAGSQKMAYTSCLASKSSLNPHRLKRMIITHLIMDEETVAKKYLVMLSHTLFYSSWANKILVLANNPNAIDADAEMSALRKGLQGDNHIAVPQKTLGADLNAVVLSDSTNAKALQYLGAYYLLSKDAVDFQQFVKRYLGTSGLPKLPKSFQEAVCTIHSNDPRYWANCGVSDSIAQHFMSFGKLMDEYKDSPLLQEKVQQEYGKTYWYYCLFVTGQ